MVRSVLATIATSTLLGGTAGAQVYGTITDLGRDGTPDFVQEHESTLHRDAGSETRVCFERDIPAVPNGGFQWLHLIGWMDSWGDPVRAIRFELYEADGLITLEDFSRPAIASFTVQKTTPLAGRDIRIDVRAPVIDLIAAGANRIGVRAILADDAPGPWINLGVDFETQEACPVCFPDWDQSGGWDGDDIWAFFADWEAGAPCTDLDGSGGVDHEDWNRFIECWQACAC